MSRGEWRPFEAAREFARSLHLLGHREWDAYARGDLAKLKGERPPDIPFAPYVTYSEQGWAGMRDWLGPPPLAPREAGYLPFLRARAFARRLKLPSVLAWRRWCTGRPAHLPPRPGNVPEDPEAMYPLAWRGWNDWLGAFSGAPFRGYRGFARAREFARSLGLADNQEWRAYKKGHRPDLPPLPEDIPGCPEHVYLFRGWNGFGDWLGTDRLAAGLKPLLPHDEASDYVVSLGLTTEVEFRDWTRGGRPDLPPRPPMIPVNPHREYAGRGWNSWGEFLQTGSTHPSQRVFRSFEEARRFVRSLRLRHNKDWRAYCSGQRADLPPQPADVPHNPDLFYRGRGWISWGDFLGTGSVWRGYLEMRPFESAREFARRLGLTSVEAWRAWVGGKRPDLPPRPADIPASPEGLYRGKGWKGWPDFLGKTRGWHRHLEFTEARDMVRALKFEKQTDYWDWFAGRRPDLAPPPTTLPKCPHAVYRREGWVSWGDFLGTGRVSPSRRQFREFPLARRFARSLRLRCHSQWKAWVEGRRPDLPPLPPDIPWHPDRTYLDRGFVSWADFLGAPADTAKGRPRPVRPGPGPRRDRVGR